MLEEEKIIFSKGMKAIVAPNGDVLRCAVVEILGKPKPSTYWVHQGIPEWEYSCRLIDPDQGWGINYNWSSVREIRLHQYNPKVMELVDKFWLEFAPLHCKEHECHCFNDDCRTYQAGLALAAKYLPLIRQELKK